MCAQPKALIIGAGLGGIATAARLARSGYQVTVLEKNDTPGGRCGQLVRDGHRFDIGATLFLMPEVFAQTYADLGEHMEEHLDLRRIDPTYTVHFADDTKISLTGDMTALQAQMEALEPGSFEGLLRYLDEGSKHYHLSLDKFVNRNFIHPWNYFNLRNLKLLYDLKPLVRHYTNIGHYFHEPHLKAAFTFQNMYLGLSPFDAPATYSLLQYTELVGGVWFPMGGLYRIVESLVSIAEAQGVRFEYEARVKQIKVMRDKACGVVLEDGRELDADVIVANADLPYVYAHLLPGSDLAPDTDDGDRRIHNVGKENRRLDHLKYTCSTIMFYWGVDKIYPQLSAHNVFLAPDYRGSFAQIFHDHTLPEEPSFYVHAPSRVDATAAPAGQDTLLVLVPVGHLDPSMHQDWPAMQARARESVLKTLAKLGIDDIEQHMKFEVCYTPRAWRRLYNLEKGSAFGLSHNVLQVGYMRPHNRHSRYHNLYFVGSSTHPGTGLPMVLLSAKLTTERILAEMGLPEPQSANARKQLTSV